MRTLLPLLVALIAIAAFFRDDALLTLVYFLVAAGVLSILWTRRALRNVQVGRIIDARAVVGDRVPMRVQLRNTGMLPVPWIHVQDSLPSEVIFSRPTRSAFWMGPKSTTEFGAELQPSKRGYYPLGPITTRGGDLFGLIGDISLGSPIQYLTVFPRIVPLAALGLPSRSPLGTLRHTQPIFEDPTRPRGKREYASGDSLKRVDWKASAATGKLQTRVYEPSVSLETVIALDLRIDSYPEKAVYDSSELAVVAAASIANWVVAHGQPIGLLTNGIDPAAGRQEAHGLLARKGRGHLMTLLETLGRAQLAAGRELAQTRPLERLLEEDGPRLSWGMTLAVITGRADSSISERLKPLARAGVNCVLILAAPIPDIALQALQAQGRRYRFEVWQAVDRSRLFEERP
jgi:uncharacterized protein (DUF58 family)